MDASIVSLLALFLLVSFSDPGAVDAHVNVDTACRNVSAGRVDYAFCVSVLRAVPNNTESDFRSLAFYASKFALDNYTHTIDVASRLIGSSSSSRAGRRQDGDGDGGDEDERQDALKQCLRYYTVGTHALQLAIDKIGYPTSPASTTTTCCLPGPAPSATRSGSISATRRPSPRRPTTPTASTASPASWPSLFLGTN
uniref:Pectinesterase inhibitor domain-containing protein n=1 Tax=Ananas comosus var. bracteatus TaxID=296719 RepID=A0A6V7PTU8_ANACO|nr:unnamed protein product [Ananas comosus var. bracteatus]